MFTGEELSEMISDVFKIHEQDPKKPSKAFRKFDGRTPYGVHPTFIAMFLLHEEKLPEEFRVKGAKALLAHDLLEDTTAKLPNWAEEPDVLRLVQGLTFSENEDSLTEVWNRGKEVILLKLYDCTANLMNTGKMSPERKKERRKKVKRIAAFVRKNYGDLYVLRLANALFKN